MKLINPKISILVGSEETIIEIYDSESNTRFCNVKLTPKQLSAALSRISMTDCDVELKGFDRVGKTMEHKEHSFEIPKDLEYNGRQQRLSEIIKDTLPDGWVSDNYFSSQNTFFEKDGKKYARTIIRRWI